MTIPRFECQNFGERECIKAVSKAAPSERMVFEILLVDDDLNILSAVSSSLADSSYRVTTALGGQKALDVLHQKPFDLVITDLNMPGVDGIAVLRRAKETSSNTKVIVMTGSVFPNSTLRLVFREANGFLPKPFGLVELYRAVASCLGSEVKESNVCNKTLCGSAEALPP
ncbi:MAG: sigma-54-dependent transcriptional response regulator [Deltaproteobacteria bacterium]|nr:sigma-54-dependent transcriptional response regulator [Deltaproteobacteria bacterium]